MSSIQRRTYEILFGIRDDDRAATIFSVFILSLIGVNVLLGILETDRGFREEVNRALGWSADSDSLGTRSYGFFFWFELISIIIFTVEYALRLWSATADPRYAGMIRGRFRMARSPMLIIDLIAILPFYLQALFPGVDLRFVRALRLFRLFRLFRSSMLARSVELLTRVIKGRKDELFISFIVVIIAVTISASVMYLAENSVNEDFSSVPQAMWWAVITITTVGYGDMHPITPVGQFIGAIIAFLGVCIFALPVGIIGAGFIEEIDAQKKQKARSDAADDESGDEQDAVAGWYGRGCDRVRRFANRMAESEVEREKAQALKLALLDVELRPTLMKRHGTVFTETSLVENEMADAFLAWLEEQLTRSREELARQFAAAQAPQQSARDHLASALTTILDAGVPAGERRRARLALLTQIGSICEYREADAL